MTTLPRFISTVAAAACLACGGAQQPAVTHVVQGRSSTPVSTLENSGILEIGSAAIDDLDRLYLSGAASGRIHVYGPGSQHSTGPAREGPGPGELSSIDDMAVLDGQLWVRNEGRPAYERFDTAGGFLGSLPFPLTTLDGQRARVIGARRDGRFWSLRPPAMPDDTALSVELIVLDSTGASWPAFASVATGSAALGKGEQSMRTAAVSAYYAVENGLAAVVVAAQTSPLDATRARGEGMSSAASAPVVIELFADDFEPIRTIVHDEAWQPFSERERRAYANPATEPANTDDAEGRPARRGLRAPVPGFMLGRDSSVWLRARPIEPDSAEWLGWRPEDVQPIRVHLPAADVLLAANREWLWTARRVGPSTIAARMRLVPVDPMHGSD